MQRHCIVAASLAAATAGACGSTTRAPCQPCASAPTTVAVEAASRTTTQALPTEETPTAVPLPAAPRFQVTDYTVSHVSVEPSYGKGARHRVGLHVREIVTPGAEIEASRAGKVLLLVHGYSLAGSVAFDIDVADCSVMRHFANRGWDVFAVDLEGFGASTRPPIMDAPDDYPDAEAPIKTAVTVKDIERTVEFIRDLRGVSRVSLLGWSQGASLEAPLYAMVHPDRLNALVLFAPRYRSTKTRDERLADAEVGRAQKLFQARPEAERWAKLGTSTQRLSPGCFEDYQSEFMASDPRSSELGFVRVPAGRHVDEVLHDPIIAPKKIKVPTLVIRGQADTYSKAEDAKMLFDELGTRDKSYVEIPDGGHFLQFEQASAQFYGKVLDFLEAHLPGAGR